MDWHRLFGLVLKDFFAGSPFDVEIELDLSAKKQMLDVLVVRKLPGECAVRLPDGFDNLADHNLVTFKSHHQPLDPWAIKEHVGHSVNYRMISPSLDQLVPDEMIRLYAVCARFPQNLADVVQLNEVQEGVFECRWGTDVIRIIVASRVPAHDHNAILHLFSAREDRVRFGATHYRQRSADTSTLISTLFEHYGLEGIAMPYTMEDFRKDFVREHLDDLTPEERLKGLPPEERVKGLSVEQLLRALSEGELKSLVERVRQTRDEKPSGDDQSG